MKEGQKVRVKIWGAIRAEPRPERKRGFWADLAYSPQMPCFSVHRELKEVVDGRFVAFGTDDGDTVAIVEVDKLLKSVALSDILL
jgi:hypothetical protein